MVDSCNFSHIRNAEAYDPLINFPGYISKVRAYVFALTSGRNNDSSFNSEVFTAACARFGVEAPAPAVSARCQHYGNTLPIIEQLKKAEAIYGRFKTKVHFKRYIEAPPSELVPKRPIVGKSNLAA